MAREALKPRFLTCVRKDPWALEAKGVVLPAGSKSARDESRGSAVPTQDQVERLEEKTSNLSPEGELNPTPHKRTSNDRTLFRQGTQS
jgi:hypothetical protein